MRQSAVLETAAALSTLMDAQSGVLAVCSERIKVRVSDMIGEFADEDTRSAVQNGGDPTVYEYYATEPGTQPEGALCYASTVIRSGKLGAEYYMTRTRYPRGTGSPEVYYTVSGEGMMLLQTEQEQIQALSITRGTVLYVPGDAYHRLVNTGDESLIVFSVYPRDATEESQPVRDCVFRRIVVASESGPDLVPNPSLSA
jgi:glucose-6-phosphate isomerase, archaeal